MDGDGRQGVVAHHRQPIHRRKVQINASCRAGSVVVEHHIYNLIDAFGHGSGDVVRRSIQNASWFGTTVPNGKVHGSTLAACGHQSDFLIAVGRCSAAHAVFQNTFFHALQTQRLESEGATLWQSVGGDLDVVQRDLASVPNHDASCGGFVLHHIPKNPIVGDEVHAGNVEVVVNGGAVMPHPARVDGVIPRLGIGGHEIHGKMSVRSRGGKQRARHVHDRYFHLHLCG